MKEQVYLEAMKFMNQTVWKKLKGEQPVLPYEHLKPVYVKFDNDALFKKLKRLPKKNIWEAQVERIDDTIYDDEDSPDFYPLFLVVVKKNGNFANVIKLRQIRSH